MALALAADPQTTIDEKTLEDPALLKALDGRHAAKTKARDAAKAAKEAHDKVTALLDAHDLDDGAIVRVGRYRIERKAIEARHVEFDTDPSSRLTIRLLEDA